MDSVNTKAYAQAMPEETRRLIFGEDKNNFSAQLAILSQSATARSSLNFNYDAAAFLFSFVAVVATRRASSA